MSTRAYVLAVRNTLRLAPPSGLGYADRECDRSGPGGKPPPFAGKWFVTVWPGGGRQYNRDRYKVNREMDVIVTLTMRVNESFDRIQDLLDAEGGDAAKGFYGRVQAIIELIHKDSYNCHVMNRANTIIGDPGNGDEPTGFRVPLMYVNDSDPRYVGPDWFHADLEEHDGAPPVGVVSDIRFGGARRLQNPANIGV